MYSYLFVGIGAVCGSILRVIIIDCLNHLYAKKNIGILIVNTLSSFLLGVYFSFYLKEGMSNYYESINLFICIGFLGSLSTFSSFIIELLNYLLKKKWKKFIFAFLNGLIIPSIALMFGFRLVNV